MAQGSAQRISDHNMPTRTLLMRPLWVYCRRGCLKFRESCVSPSATRSKVLYFQLISTSSLRAFNCKFPFLISMHHLPNTWVQNIPILSIHTQQNCSYNHSPSSSTLPTLSSPHHVISHAKALRAPGPLGCHIPRPHLQARLSRICPRNPPSHPARHESPDPLPPPPALLPLPRHVGHPPRKQTQYCPSQSPRLYL